MTERLDLDTWPQPGDLIYWYSPIRPAGWHVGAYKRTIARGRHKGDAEVAMHGDLLPARVVRVPLERMRQRPGNA